MPNRLTDDDIKVVIASARKIIADAALVAPRRISDDIAVEAAAIITLCEGARG